MLGGFYAPTTAGACRSAFSGTIHSFPTMRPTSLPSTVMMPVMSFLMPYWTASCVTHAAGGAGRPW